MNKTNKKHLSIREICLFAILGALMFISKIVMETLPNIHLLGMLTITYTIVFRKKALIPIYTYVLLNGLFAGFNPWWVPYLYIWTLLWGATMLIPKNTPKAVACVVYPMLCALHGLLFGVLYAPVQALMYGFSFEQTLAWITTGLTFDVIHMVGNFAVGLLIFPVSEVLKRLVKNI
jgi:energy-coupling factor transport system substrate-specific component